MKIDNLPETIPEVNASGNQENTTDNNCDVVTPQPASLPRKKDREVVVVEPELVRVKSLTSMDSFSSIEPPLSPVQSYEDVKRFEHRQGKRHTRSSSIFHTIRRESTIIVMTLWASFRGVFLALVSALLFSITTVIVKFLTGIDPGMMAIFRFLSITLFSFASVCDMKADGIFGPKNCRIFLALRGVVGATSLYLRYCTLKLLPLANATIITLSMPVFVCIFARIFLKEAFGIFHAISLAITFVGIGFTAKLDVIFGEPTTADEGLDRSTQLLGLACGMATAIVGSSAYILVRKVKHLHHATILFNFAYIATVEVSVVTYFSGGLQLPECGIAPWLLIVLGVLSFYAQLTLTKALQVEEAGIVSVTRSSGELILAFLFQIIIFNNMPDLYTVIGALLVSSAVILTSIRKYIVTLPGNHRMRKIFAFTLK